MRTVLLVGLRLTQPGWEIPDTGAYRMRNWQVARQRWERLLPDVEIFEGHHDEPGPFSLAKASNRAAAVAGDWDMAVYVGADFMVGGEDQIRRAIATSQVSGMLTLAHGTVVMTNEESAEAVRQGAEPSPDMGDTHVNSFTGVLTVPRSLWDLVQGFDERFVGWGWDDQAFWASCWAMAGGFKRVDGFLYHLWHPRVRTDNEENPYYRENEVLGRRYLDARRSKPNMVRIIRERYQ